MNYGRYRIIKDLGEGNMSYVYVAHDPQFDSRVALKVLKKKRAADEEIFQRFLNEPKVARRAAHPNIVTVYDVGLDHGTVYIAMELIEGKSLDKVIKENRLTLRQIVEIGIQIATALDSAHQKGIFHRDIKPANIILSSNGQVKVTDFGIARIQDLKQTIAGTILGTPIYMSPEQTRGQPVDGRSDLYSLGAVLYELTTGKPPFQGKTWEDLSRKIANDKPAPLFKKGEPLPPELSTLILKSLEKNPNRRFQTGNEMKASLQECLSEIKDDTNWIQILKKTAIFFGIIIFVVGLYFVISYLLTPKALLKVRTTPPGAQVFIDGEFKDKTPFDIKLPFGEFDLRFILQDYDNKEVTIQLEKKDETLDFKLDPLEPMKKKSSDLN